MPSLNIRNVPPRLARALKSLAKQRGESIDRTVVALLEESTEDRLSALRQIEAGWRQQARRPEPGEIDAWTQTGPA